MFIAKVIGLACLAAVAHGALPVPGAPYRIQSVGSKLVVDNMAGLPNAGNPINVFPLNNDVPGPQAQLISVDLIGANINAGINAGSSIYKFKFPLAGVGAYMRGPPTVGLSMNAQNFSTEFLVTEVALGVVAITWPFSNLALTSPTTTSIPISLQLYNTSNTLQQWRFLPVSL